MKTISILLLVATTAFAALAQQPKNGGKSELQAVEPGSVRVKTVGLQELNPQAGAKFDLDFPGGKPADLIRAVEKARGKPLNVIIPEDLADVQIPPLKMRSVTVSALFLALENASKKTTWYTSGANRMQYETSYGFRTAGPASDDGVWYFFHDLPPPPPAPSMAPKMVKFWHLEPYLDKYKIEDITTAVQTGWKMLGEKVLPEMNFHKDTKLLIVMADRDKLRIVDDVLGQLQLTADKLTFEKSAKSAKP